MRRLITYFTLCLFLLMGNGQAFALQYQTVFLKKAAQKLLLDSVLEAKKNKNVAKNFDYKGNLMVVHYDGNAVVDHLGIAIFSEKMKKENPSPVYDFLERAYLDHIYKVSENNLYLNQIQFQTGSWDSFKKVNTSLPCRVNNGMDKFYTIQWQQNGKTFLSIAFPANYEYFANDSRRNLEQQFVDLLRNFKSGKGVAKENVNINDLGKVKGKNLYVKKGKWYVIPSINSDAFYQMEETPQVEEGDTIYRLSCKPMMSKEFPRESFSNLLMGKGRNANVHLVFSMSNRKEEECKVRLFDFLTYCTKQGCKAYFGYEGEENGLLQGTLVMSNKANGYDHVIYFSAKKSCLTDTKEVLEGKVYLYAPSTNVKELFAKPSPKRNNRKVNVLNIK